MQHPSTANFDELSGVIGLDIKSHQTGRIRREYQIRINLWLSLCRASLPILPLEPVQAPQPRRPDASDDLRAWLSQAPGQALVAEVRWSLLRLAAARLRAARRCGRLNKQSLTTLLLEQGGARLLCPEWQECVASLSVCCVCPPANAPRIACCWSCGGLPPHSCCWAPAVSLVPLAWPHRLPSCNHTLHYRGQCCWNCGAHTQQAPSAPIAGCTGLAALRLALGADSRAVPGRRRTACLDGTVAAPETCSPVAAGIHPPAKRCYSRSPGKGANCKRCPRLCQSTAPSAPCCSCPLLRAEPSLTRMPSCRSRFKKSVRSFCPATSFI